MSVLLTGAAGFIGHHVARALTARGDRVVGVDSLNSYYDPALKRARVAALGDVSLFSFTEGDICDRDLLSRLMDEGGCDRIVHLAAQAGVPHSLTHPFDYVDANMRGHLSVLEVARARADRLSHLVYASSSSVYGGSSTPPYREDEPADTPVSLYAATKRADELMSQAYAHLFALPQTGLRFFTVYGPWGRPDMSYWIFTEAILTGAPVRLFNEGRNRRDFTYVDDIVRGVVDVLDRPPARGEGEGGETHRVLNIGNNRAETVTHLLDIIEEVTGRKAVRDLLPARPGDVFETLADTSRLEALTGFRAATRIEQGLPRFVEWYRAYTGR